MPSTYSPLKIELPATGEQSGTWGNTTNTNLGTALEEAITGSANVTFASGNVVLTLTDTNASQVARNLRLNLIGVTGGSTRTLTVPAIKKLYLVSNNCADSVIVGNATGATVTVPAGNNIFIYNDGTDVLNAITYITALNAASVSAGSVTTTQVDIVSQGDLRLQDTTGGQFVALQAPGTIASSYTLTLPVDDGTDGQALVTDGNGVLSWSTAASGDVYGPASATDNAIARFDLTTGKIIQNSAVTIADTTGSLNFTAAGARITGDFSAGTVANRLSFQSSTVNGVTAIPVLPNGTATTARHDYFNNSDPANAGFGRIEINTTAFAFQAGLTGTGSFLPITFLTSNTERLRIATTGFVGINTASPGTFLDVVGPTGSVTAPAYLNQTAVSVRNNFHARVALVNADAGTFESAISSYGAGASFPTQTLSFATGPTLVYLNGNASATPTEKFRVDSAGNFCIGTTVAAGILTVSSSISSANSNGGIYFGASGSPAGQQSFGTNAAIARAGSSGFHISTAAAGDFCMAAETTKAILFATASSGSPVERLRIESNGNVGIGINGPIYPLDVAGVIRSGNGSVAGGLLIPGTGNPAFQVVTNQGTANSASLINIWGNASNPGVLVGTNRADGTAFQVGTSIPLTSGVPTGVGTTAFIVQGGGNVGVGTSTPAARLQVSGTTYLSGDTATQGALELASLGTGDRVSLIDFHSSGTPLSIDYSFRLIREAGVNGNFALFNTGTGAMTFATNSSERMRISSAGNVLIGVTVGAAKLNILGDDPIKLNNAAATNESNINFLDAQTLRISTFNSSGSNITFNTNPSGGGGVERLRINSTGNVGIGVIPAAWGTTFSQKVLQIGSVAALSTLDASVGNRQVTLSNNAYFDNTNQRYIISDFANMYRQVNGEHQWSNAPSGTAGNVITYTQAMTLTAAGNVGIGTSSPGNRLTIAGGNASISDGTFSINRTTYPVVQLQQIGSTGLGQVAMNGNDFEFRSTTAHPMLFYTNNLERMRINSRGDVGIGVTPSAWVGTNPVIEFGSGTVSASLFQNGANDTWFSSNLFFNGSSWVHKATGTATQYHQSNGVHIWFNTGSGTAGATVTPTERMRLTAGGQLLVGSTNYGTATQGSGFGADGFAYHTRSGDTPLVTNRLVNDGVLISLQQDSVEEGNISVSGTTVSYNGGHLSRWSQLPDGSKDDAILKGTVLTNLDDMCIWEKDGVIAENEQLNKMKVSDVEGDTNVAGVFVNWTMDEQYGVNDMNVAMTGDMIIRIADGVVVQKGDLLMSAGDGTAKPQGDDIVRSKTIAKVTSNHVTCTYADGSYCVPCVLMAC
jgi:hypothetical protein